MSDAKTGNRFDVVIVGGGASGVLTAINLMANFQATADRKTLSVALINDVGKTGRGPAYSTPSPEHLLNVPAKGMSALPDQPDHFVSWLNKKYGPMEPETFARRMYFGDYIEELLEETRQLRHQDVFLVIEQDLAVDVIAGGDSAKVELAGGKVIEGRSVVLALGNFAPAEVAKISGPRYHANPWHHEELKAIKSDEDVLLIGSGLTMIDVAVELHAAGHHGRLLAVSRHGYLPRPHFEDERVRRENGTYYLPLQLPTRLPRLFRLVRNTCRSANEQQMGNWRFVINELRLKVTPVWQSLDARDKKMFLRHVRHLWEIHRHRMAHEISVKLEGLKRSGQLNIVAGRVAELVDNGNSFEVTIELRQGGEQRTRVQQIVNCIGPQSDLKRVRHKLIQSMLSKGLLNPDDLRLGADTTESAMLIGSDGKPIANLYAIGPLRKSQLWECTAIPDIRGQAKHLAETVLKQLQSNQSTVAQSMMTLSAVP